ncbi:MAG: LacI family transcriptional regulator [Microbacteriaceae bacterium]|nr:LacI family transcriptional regulator [Microbacteriaceae bacterium]
MANIYDVATLAGVSPATVSRVLNGMRVSPPLAERVRAAAAELDFTPNRTARTLRKQNSEVIALIIPDIENPFFTSLARGVEDRAQESGYSVVLCNSDEDPSKEARYIGIALSEHMAGVILAPASDHSDLSGLIARKRPVVAVDRAPHGFEVDAVTVDNRAGGVAAATALFDGGFTRVACITGPNDVETAQLRSAGWREVAESRGASTDLDAFLRHANYRVDGGVEAMEQLLALPEPPDAVVVANNLMGIGALQVLRAAGLSPEQFGIAVFGDLPFSPLAPSGVRVIQLPARQLGFTAAALLMERIAGDDQPARTVILQNE